MKLLVVHPSTDLYGSDRQLLESVDGLGAARAEVTVVLPGDGPLASRFPDATVITAAFPVLRKAQLRPVRLLVLIATMPVAVARLIRLIVAAAPDVVYVNTVTLPHWVLAARLARRPVLVHVHEAEEMSAPAVRRALYAPLLAASRVIVNSATTARVVSQSWPRLRRRMDVVPNGVPDPGPCPTETTVPGRLVVVSRLSPRKGIDVALEALALLRSEGRDVHLVLCGSTFAGYEWFERELRERAARPDLAGRVEFAGFVDHVREVVAGAQVVVVPSLGESFGNAAVEGMLAGRPVVVSDVQGLSEIVTDGHTGLLAPAGDAPAFAKAIARLLDDPDLRDELARDGRASATQRFSIEQYRAAIVASAEALVVA